MDVRRAVSQPRAEGQIGSGELKGAIDGGAGLGNATELGEGAAVHLVGLRALARRRREQSGDDLEGL